jgi:hypothetical protein
LGKWLLVKSLKKEELWRRKRDKRVKLKLEKRAHARWRKGREASTFET